MKKTTLAFLLICITLISACSKFDNYEPDPPGTIALNMYDESNGKTLLGFSDVYINKSFNFKSSSSVINGYGRGGGLATQLPLNFSNLVLETAVQRGDLYQVYDRSAIFQFPSGQHAIVGDGAFYKMFVKSIIIENGRTIGAEVKYVTELPDTYGLPEMNTHLGAFNTPGDQLEIMLPSNNVELFLERYREVDNFDIGISGNMLTIRLIEYPNPLYGPYGDYDLYIRRGNVFTVIQFFVNR